MQLHFMKNISGFGNGAVAYVTYAGYGNYRLYIFYMIKQVFKIFVTTHHCCRVDCNMSSPLIHEIKGHAFRFLREKLKTARLVLTDVTPVQLMTEEATNENPWPPDTRTMSIISRAAFEVDEYERIVEILHHRLSKFDKGYWRASYKALILLEHLLTHGPKRVSEEFKCDIRVIDEIGRFQHIDEKGFNWGLSVRKLSERILKLLKNKDYVIEERARARDLSRAIKGFGSFNQRSSTIDKGIGDLPSKIYGRCNSYYGSRQYDFTSLGNKLSSANGNEREHQIHEDIDNSKLLKQENDSNSGEDTQEYHPFIDQEKVTTSSLLSV
ncbi:hypothetical protein VNO78_14727 [Psophocarpus tetragonolobus]|uniref:ENTH domain-containing protein n=1 Tax=Psophocarpus tetragonolobus TaxID=3891 RepID=A0AAN9SDR0_PSOTE